MADQKDQRSDPPVEDPTFIPLKKGAMAEKSLHGSEEAPESKAEHDPESSDSGDDKDMIDGFAEELRKKKLDEHNRKAFYSVLLAFRSENSKIGKKRSQTTEKLMKEWNNSHETRVSFEDNIKKNLVAQRQSVDSDVKETQIVEAKPLTISVRQLCSGFYSRSSKLQNTLLSPGYICKLRHCPLEECVTHPGLSQTTK